MNLTLMTTRYFAEGVLVVTQYKDSLGVGSDVADLKSCQVIPVKFDIVHEDFDIDEMEEELINYFKDKYSGYMSICIHIRKKEIFKNVESRIIERVSYVNTIQNGDLRDIDFARKFYRGDIML